MLLAGDMEYKMIIYKTTNIINGKFYIGQDSKNDPNYLGSGLLLNRAIEKYGIENFKKEMVEKRTANQKGKKWSEERRKKYEERGNAFAGKKHTQESIDKIKKNIQNKTPEQKLEKYIKFHISRFGYEPSEEKKLEKLNYYKEL